MLETTVMTECNGKDTPTLSDLPKGPELGLKPAEKNFKIILGRRSESSQLHKILYWIYNNCCQMSGGLENQTTN
eukprot:9955807-Ditylum_brightwellii.AAC.1